MSRPLKLGLVYFSHDCYASNDEKMERLQAVYPHIGYAVYFKLLESIYRIKDNELDVSEPEGLKIIATRLDLSPAKAKKIIEKCVDLGLFYEDLYKNSNKLSSDRIQRQAKKINAERERQRLKYLNTIGETTGETTRETIGETIGETPQSKVKESKVKESKGNIKGKNITDKKIYGQFGNVYLLDEEYQKLKERFTESGAKDLIERLSEGKESKGYKYDSDYAAALTWSRKAGGSVQGSDGGNGNGHKNPLSDIKPIYSGPEPGYEESGNSHNNPFANIKPIYSGSDPESVNGKLE